MKAAVSGILLGGDGMLKNWKKHLILLLKIISIASFSNILLIYWLPISLPFSSFSVVRLAVTAMIEKRYYLVLGSILVCILLFFATLSIRKQKLLLPALSLIYMAYDFCIVLSLLVEGFSDSYWRMYILRTIFSTVVMALLFYYCWNCTQRILHNCR